MEIELPTWFWLPLTKNSCAAIAFLFRVGIAFRIAEAISRGPLIGPCDGSTTRFTAYSSTWLQRVRHVCKIDGQVLLGRGGGNVRKSCRAWQWSYSDVLLGVVVIKRCTFWPVYLSVCRRAFSAPSLWLIRLPTTVVICRCSESSPGRKYRLDRAQTRPGERKPAGTWLMTARQPTADVHVAV